MKKVGIVTLHGNFNYGNRLQNYALKKAVESFGFEVETVIVPLNCLTFKQRIFRKVKNTFKKITINKNKANKNWEQLLSTKEPMFTPFTEKYLNNRRIYKGINNDFSFFIVGSDQVWNPNYIGENSLFFLSFADKYKRISYAASFGVSEIPENMQVFYSKMLSSMEKISVREEAGKQIVESLTDKKAHVLVDPTMLLSVDEWNQLINSKKDLKDPQNKKYIYIYIVETLSEEYYLKIEKYAKENSLEIIQVMGHHFDSNYKIYDPIEFIEKIKNAQMIFTDSFHGGVFSIIFHTPFVIFDRSEGNMGSRIDTLLDTFNLQKNKYTKNMNFQELLNTDFSNVDDKLAEKRAESISFLKKALNKE